MHLQWRTMLPTDIPECIDLITEHPVTRNRYGTLLDHLPHLLLRLPGEHAFLPIVLSVGSLGQVELIGLAIIAVISDAFAVRLKPPPLVWIGPEIISRVLAGDSPLLSHRQMAQANLKDGLNLAVCMATTRLEHSGAEIRTSMIAAFLELTAGFNAKEAFTQAECEAQAQVILNVGGYCLTEDMQQRTSLPPGELQELVYKPHIVSVTRALAAQRPGSWMSMLFTYDPPRIGLSDGQRRLLSAAINGGTDDELAAELGVSISAIKKTWQSIYNRVMERTPDILPPDCFDDKGNQRGKSKKHRLLCYARRHPEELRPARN